MRKRSLIAWLICVVGSAGIAPVLDAQILPITVPKNKLRLDFLGQLQSYDWRWNDGSRNEAAAAFNNRVMDASFIPGLAAAEQRVRTITGRNDLALNLGTSRASQLVNLGTTGFGGAYGLTRSITIHGMVPLVAVKVSPRVLIDSAGSTAGFNPASEVFGNVLSRGQTTAFLSVLRGAIAALRAKIAAGDYDANPGERQAADQAVIKGTMLDTELTALLQGVGSDFAPRDGSQAGQLIQAEITAFRTTLAALRVVMDPGSPALASQGLTYSGFENYLINPDGPIGMRPIDEIPALSYLGDIEVGVAVAVIDHFPSASLGSGFRAVIDATVRLRTAQLDSPDRPFDVGTGDRQPDVEVSLTADYVTGRLGARFAGGYNLQLPGNQNRRVTRYDQPIALRTSLAGVRRDPGDVFRVSAHPFFRLAPYLSMFAGADYWTRGRDAFTYAVGQPEVAGVDIAVLGDGTASDALLLSGGLSYSHSGLNKRGGMGLPMDASFRYERIARSTKGIIPDINSVRIDLRFYTRLFGGGR